MLKKYGNLTGGAKNLFYRTVRFKGVLTWDNACAEETKGLQYSFPNSMSSHDSFHDLYAIVVSIVSAVSFYAVVAPIVNDARKKAWLFTLLGAVAMSISALYFICATCVPMVIEGRIHELRSMLHSDYRDEFVSS